MQEPNGSDGARLAGLDGLRALSIGAVLLLHFYDAPGSIAPDFVARIALQGGFGVTAFFVISGFLITYLLLEEEQRNGTINLGAFYYRRCLRILPPALFFLSVVSVVSRTGLVNMNVPSTNETLAATFFVRNWLTGGSRELAHFWTLSIEEQFYLLWPSLLIVLGTFRRRVSVLSFLVAFAPVWRWLQYRWAGGAIHVNSWRTDLRYDPLLVGCLLACLRSHPRVLNRLRSGWLQHWLVPWLALGIVALLIARGLPGPLGAFNQTGAILLLCVVVSYLVDNPAGNSLSRFLNSRPLVWIGTLSYSLYVWQQPFSAHASLPQEFRRLPLSLLLALSCAVFSYKFIEQPLLAFKKRRFSAFGAQGGTAGE